MERKPNPLVEALHELAESLRVWNGVLAERVDLTGRVDLGLRQCCVPVPSRRVS